MKINTIKHSTIVIAYLLCGSVILSGAHAKDLVKNSVTDLPGHTLKDVNAKALSELHNHAEKTSLKHFAKAVSDNGLLSRQRELKADSIKAEKTLLNHFADALLYWRMAISLRA